MMRPSGIPTIHPLEADALLADEPAALLVDVREPGEFFMVRAPGAVLVPLSRFVATHRDLPRDRTLLVVCQSGVRSAQATAYLLANGWADVRNVAGGMDAWQAAGLDVRSGPLEPGEGDLAG